MLNESSRSCPVRSNIFFARHVKSSFTIFPWLILGRLGGKPVDTTLLHCCCFGSMWKLNGSTDLSGSLRFRTRATFAESARAGGGAHVCSSYKLLKLTNWMRSNIFLIFQRFQQWILVILESWNNLRFDTSEYIFVMESIRDVELSFQAIVHTSFSARRWMYVPRWDLDMVLRWFVCFGWICFHGCT